MLSKKPLLEALEWHSARHDIYTDLNTLLLAIGLIEIRESIDKAVEQRIESDKVLERLLNDICAGIDSLNKSKSDSFTALDRPI